MIHAGNVLGPYEVRSLLGAGGMGEVYRARDTRLGRDVALKILPRALLGDSSRLDRFAMEARAASALNHPNIVSVFDVNLDSNPPYIVSELVEGASLRVMIGRGPVPVRQLLDVAAQMADGLSAAHKAQIVHRDLKPENILVTPDGRPKILDFGLAKQIRATVPIAMDQSTLVAGLTVAGTVLGTVHYMSPEQARGRDVDTRSDVFSFGVILYEMAAGKLPFACESAVETLSAIIGADPLPIERDIPTSLRWTIERCLAKDPGQRYQSTQDLLLELRQQRDRLTVSIVTTPPTPAVAARPRTFRKWRAVLLSLGAFLLGAGAAAFLAAPSEPNLTVGRFRPLATSSALEDGAAWSPDGRTIAYHAGVGRLFQIFTKNLDSPTSLQVTHCPADCKNPQWSPDGGRLFFQMTDSIWSVGAAGGMPQVVLRDAFAFSLSRNGNTLAFARMQTNPLSISIWLSSPPGATPVRYQPAPFEGSTLHTRVADVAFAPNGKQLLFWAPFSSPGRTSEYWLLPIPPSAGKPRRVLESLNSSMNLQGASWMPDGRRIVLAFTSPEDPFRSHLYLAAVDGGTAYPLMAGIGAEGRPQVSGDGRRLAFTEIEYDANIVEIPLDGSGARDLIATNRMERSPSWSPRGRDLVYVSDRGGRDEIWISAAERGWERPLATSTNASQLLDSPVFSPDGERIAFVRTGKEGPAISISPVAGGTPVPLTNIEVPQVAPTWSPDGNWIAFYSRGKPGGLMKLRVGSTDAPVLLKTTNGVCPYCVPDWSPRGDAIAYYTDEGTALVSPVDGSARIVRRPPFLAAGWSHDGATLYGFVEESGKQRIVSLDIATGKERLVSAIDPKVHAGQLMSQSLRLSLSPDGKSLATTAVRNSGDIWMMEDFDNRRSLAGRFGLFRR